MTPHSLSLPLRIVPPIGQRSAYIEEANGRVICQCHEYDAEQIVRSVNAFPELLAKFKELVEWLLPDLREDTKAYGDPKRLAQIDTYAMEAKAAIANAEREEQKV